MNRTIQRTAPRTMPPCRERRMSGRHFFAVGKCRSGLPQACWWPCWLRFSGRDRLRSTHRCRSHRHRRNRHRFSNRGLNRSSNRALNQNQLHRRNRMHLPIPNLHPLAIRLRANGKRGSRWHALPYVRLHHRSRSPKLKFRIKRRARYIPPPLLTPRPRQRLLRFRSRRQIAQMCRSG